MEGEELPAREGRSPGGVCKLGRRGRVLRVGGASSARRARMGEGCPWNGWARVPLGGDMGCKEVPEQHEQGKRDDVRGVGLRGRMQPMGVVSNERKRLGVVCRLA